MSDRKRKSSGSSAVLVGVAAIIGAGIGFLASKLFESQQKKEQKSPVIVQKEQKYTFTRTDIDSYDQLQELMTCPITHQIMHEPCVLTTCGHSFEKSKIQEWIKTQKNCPLCKAQASSQNIKLNYQLKQIIHQYQRNKNNPKNQTQTLKK